MFVNTWFTNALNTWYLSLKNGKIDLAWLNFFCVEHSSQRHEAENITRKVERVYLTNSFIHGFPETRLVLTILHTPSKKEKGTASGLCRTGFLTTQSFFGSTNTTTNSRDELLAERFDIVPSTALKYLRPRLQSILSKLEESVLPYNQLWGTIQLHSKWNGHVQHKYSGLSKHHTPHDSLVTFPKEVTQWTFSSPVIVCICD